MDLSLDNASPTRSDMVSWGWSSAVSLAVHAVFVALCYRAVDLGSWPARFTEEPRFIRVIIGDPAPAVAAPLGVDAPSAPPTDTVTVEEPPATVAMALEHPVATKPATPKKAKPSRPVRSARTRRPADEPPPAVVGSSYGAVDATGCPQDTGDASFGATGHGTGGAPEPIDRIAPQYPERARARGVEGRVLLSIVLDPGGRVEEDIRVLRSIPLLDDAAISAVRRWRFHPARDTDGRAVRARVEIPVQFVLH